MVEVNMAKVSDQAMACEWWQAVNQHGILMTHVVCLKSGWSAESNSYPFGAVTGEALDYMFNLISATKEKRTGQSEFANHKS